LVPISIACSASFAVLFAENGAIKSELRNLDMDEIEGGGSQLQEPCFASPLVGCYNSRSLVVRTVMLSLGPFRRFCTLHSGTLVPSSVSFLLLVYFAGARRPRVLGLRDEKVGR
jgi:hypothetical protein